MAMQLFLLVYKWIAARPYRRTNQRRVPTIIFFSSVACTIQVSMQTTGFHTRLLKCIDILVCSGPEEKKIRIYRRIMASLHSIITAQKRAMVVPASSIATVFVNTSRVCIQYTDNQSLYSNNSYHYVCICTTQAYFLVPY